MASSVAEAVEPARELQRDLHQVGVHFVGADLEGPLDPEELLDDLAGSVVRGDDELPAGPDLEPLRQPGADDDLAPVPLFEVGPGDHPAGDRGRPCLDRRLHPHDRHPDGAAARLGDPLAEDEGLGAQDAVEPLELVAQAGDAADEEIDRGGLAVVRVLEGEVTALHARGVVDQLVVDAVGEGDEEDRQGEAEGDGAERDPGAPPVAPDAAPGNPEDHCELVHVRWY